MYVYPDQTENLSREWGDEGGGGIGEGREGGDGEEGEKEERIVSIQPAWTPDTHR